MLSLGFFSTSGFLSLVPVVSISYVVWSAAASSGGFSTAHRSLLCQRTQVKNERKDPGCSPAAKAEATNKAGQDSHIRFISFSPHEPSEHVDVGLTPLRHRW